MVIKLLVAVYFIFVVSPSFAIALKDRTYGIIQVDEITSVYDGDTFRANINSWPSIVGQRMSIRINGIDTPEMRGKCPSEKDLARLAKQSTVKALRSAKIIELRNIKRGKYFRIVADVYVDGESVAKELIDRKLAVKYDGGTKVNWCK